MSDIMLVGIGILIGVIGTLLVLWYLVWRGMGNSPRF